MSKKLWNVPALVVLSELMAFVSVFLGGSPIVLLVVSVTNAMLLIMYHKK